jgi:hypothetical protein
LRLAVRSGIGDLSRSCFLYRGIRFLHRMKHFE